MSVPVSSFSKLSLSQDRMQSSRGQRRGPSGAKGKQPMPPDSSSSASDSDSDPEDPDNSHDMTEPEPEPEHVLALHHCRHIGAEDDPRYAFQIADAEVVRYGVRVKPTITGLPQCSCDQNSESVCRHVRWLLDQLHRTGMATTANISPDYYGQITAAGLENICEDLHWELRKGTESDEEETTWKLKKDYRVRAYGLHTRAMIRERLKEIRDILATLSNESSVDYRKDIFESVDDISLEDVLVPHDLEATISRLLVNDDDVFSQFKSLISHNTRALDFFRKMNLKAKHSCHLLDEYVQHGPATGQHDLIWCSRQLVDIVNIISVNVTERQPLNSESRKEAAKSLVSILLEVVKNRNTDVYQDDRLPRRRQHGEPHTDRNLYQRLIGSISPQNPVGNTFVIKALQDLPEAQAFIEDLEEILSILETIGWGPAPKPYREKLAALIAQLKRSPGPSALSLPSKRPATGGDRKIIKRMK
jgi:hypothetical protein